MVRFFGVPVGWTMSVNMVKNRLKPLLAVGLRRVAILVVLLRILALLGHVNDPRWRLYLQ